MQMHLYERPAFECSEEDSRMEQVIVLLKQAGVDVQRSDCLADQDAFAQNRAVWTCFRDQGEQVLPITTIDSRIVKTGAYPENHEIAAWLEGCGGRGPGCCQKRKSAACTQCSGCAKSQDCSDRC